MHYPRLFIMTLAESTRAPHSSIVWPVQRLFTKAAEFLPSEIAAHVLTGPIVSGSNLNPTGERRPLVLLGGFDETWWRRGCTASIQATLCTMWDGLDLPALRDRRRLPCPPLAIVGHLHHDDLIAIAPSALGLAARVLWCSVHEHSYDGAVPKPLAEDHLASLARQLACAITDVDAPCEIQFERNFGGDLGLAVLQRARRNLPVKMVTASRGKHVRAEPIALLYEQDKVRHAGSFPHLEDQLCAMRPDGYAGAGSPDRLDALVWALTELSGPPSVAYLIGGGHPYTGP